MNLFRKLFLISFTFSIAFCHEYLLIPFSENVFATCPDYPDNPMTRMADLSNLTLTYSDDSVHCAGTVKIIWNTQPSDRIVLKSNIFRFQRGTWVPTMFSMFHRNFCPRLWDKTMTWYHSTKHILEEDRKCFSYKGHTYRIEPHDIGMKFNIPGLDMSGNYKLNVILEDVNADGDLQDFICFEVLGEMKRI